MHECPERGPGHVIPYPTENCNKYFEIRGINLMTAFPRAHSWGSMQTDGRFMPVRGYQSRYTSQLHTQNYLLDCSQAGREGHVIRRKNDGANCSLFCYMPWDSCLMQVTPRVANSFKHRLRDIHTRCNWKAYFLVSGYYNIRLHDQVMWGFLFVYATSLS
jgi:hypothetical protein